MGPASLSRRVAGAALLVAIAAHDAAAQSGTTPTPRPGGSLDGAVFAMLQNMRGPSAEAIAPLVNALLGDTGGHMRMAPPRTPTAADSARAAAIVRTMRASLSPYADVALAEQDGYEKFMPWLEPQVVYHYNNLRHAAAARDSTDITKPTSLLYRKGDDGRLRLVGAMYTAPWNASLAELDARLPLAIAHWHQHVDFCAPMRGDAVETLRRGDSARLQQWLAISTREACSAAGGFFIPQLFGWMVHVDAWAGETPAEIWGGHGRDRMRMHQHGHH